jgi:cytochrome c-550 PedF
MTKLTRTAAVVLGLSLAAGAAFGHGDVSPQPIDVTGLNPVGADWLKENPYRADPAQYEIAKKIGSSGYNQNCARCHGLQVISGGLAPDLRFLDKGKDGDEWFINRIRHGYTQNGTTKMPAFEGTFSQEAMWAIRSYLDSVHED